MKINWKVRWNNETFWMDFIPAIAFLATTIFEIFRVTLETDEIVSKVIAVVKAVFGIATLLGIVVDPTTEGIGDSDRALHYNEPWKDFEPEDE